MGNITEEEGKVEFDFSQSIRKQFSNPLYILIHIIRGLHIHLPKLFFFTIIY